MIPRGISQKDIEQLVSLAGEQLGYVMDELYILREILKESINKGKLNIESIKQAYDKIIRLRDKAVGVKRAIYEFLARTPIDVRFKEDWIRITSRIIQIADYIEGISYRLQQIACKGWSIDREILDYLLKIVNKVDDACIALKDAIRLLTRDVRESLRKLDVVREREKEVDILYRNVDMKVLESSGTALIFMLTTITGMLENTADTLEDLSDDLLMLITSYI